MIFHKQSRRMFLFNSGKLLAIPLLPSLLPKSAWGQALSVPTRFVGICSENGGQANADWFPEGDPANRVLLYSATTNPRGAYYNSPDHYIHHGPIVFNPSTGISRIFDQKFNPYVGKLLFLRGMDTRQANYQNHYGGPLFGNFWSARSSTNYLQNMPTIDQVMAYSTGFYPNGGVGYVPSLPIRMTSQGNYLSHSSWNFKNPTERTGGIEGVASFYDPRAAFNRLFPNGSTSSEQTTPPPSTPTPIVDSILSDYQQVISGRAISSTDRQILQTHIDHLATIEKELNNLNPPPPPQMGCNSGPQPAAGSIVSAAHPDNQSIAAYKLMNSIVVAGLSCQRTRVATYWIDMANKYSSGSANTVGDWHWASHAGNGNTQARNIMTGITKWIADHVFYDLISKMDAIIEGDGRTLLDNSMVQLSTAAANEAHTNRSLPCLIAGSAGGFFSAGKYIDYTNRSFKEPRGILFNQYLCNAMMAMGLSPSDWNMRSLGVLPSHYPTNADGYGEYLGHPSDQYGFKYDAVYKKNEADVTKKLPFATT